MASNEIIVKADNVRACADELSRLAQKIRNYKLGITVTKSKGAVADKTRELKTALESAAESMAALVDKTAQTTFTAADTFVAMDESMKY